MLPLRYYSITELIEFLPETPFSYSKKITSIGDCKIYFGYRNTKELPFFHVVMTVEYDSDDESGGSISFKSETIIPIDRKHNPVVADHRPEHRSAAAG